MKKGSRKYFAIAGTLFVVFVLLIVVLLTVDVKPIGPEQSTIGLATINEFVFNKLGTNMLWYNITEWCGIISIVIAVGFGLLGIFQLIKAKSIKGVDKKIIALGIFYALVIASYIVFEIFTVNYRPVIIDQKLSASFPSSHTMIVLCIMSTAMIQFHYLIYSKPLKWTLNFLSTVIICITVIGRLISGVHWFTDILGGILLGASLIFIYYGSVLKIERSKKIM